MGPSGYKGRLTTEHFWPHGFVYLRGESRRFVGIFLRRLPSFVCLYPSSLS